MADYSTIKGFTIQTLASDPSNPGAGQVWYNSTSATVKGYGAQGTAAWAAGGAVNTGRNMMASAGTQTAAMIMGGDTAPITPGTTDFTEQYDGSSWTETADLNTARAFVSGAGSQTAAVIMGGGPGLAITELWDGTSWTEVADLNQGRQASAACGTGTAALLIGGQVPPNTEYRLVEEWDGTSWTEVADINGAPSPAGNGIHNNMAASQGTVTAALQGGGTPAAVHGKLSETYNGTSWTQEAEFNTFKTMSGGAGTSTFALAFGGAPPPGIVTEQWNGTSWTEVADLAGCRTGPGSGGSATTAWDASGLSCNPGATKPTDCEEWSTADATKTFTAS